MSEDEPERYGEARSDKETASGGIVISQSQGAFNVQGDNHSLSAGEIISALAVVVAVKPFIESLSSSLGERLAGAIDEALRSAVRRFLRRPAEAEGGAAAALEAGGSRDNRFTGIRALEVGGSRYDPFVSITLRLEGASTLIFLDERCEPEALSELLRMEFSEFGSSEAYVALDDNVWRAAVYRSTESGQLRLSILDWNVESGQWGQRYEGTDLPILMRVSPVLWGHRLNNGRSSRSGSLDEWPSTPSE